MNVHYMCPYYSQWAHDNLARRTQEQWDCYKFCRAVKNRSINGYTTVPRAGGSRTINETNIGLARKIFGEFIVETLKGNDLADAVLIPIPSKDGLEKAKNFRTLEMLREALPEAWHASICPAIRWNKQIAPASAGGPRSRVLLRPHLSIVSEIPLGKIVLIDDLFTTGSHFLACLDKLDEVQRSPSAVIACGYTTDSSTPKTFGSHITHFEIDRDLF